MKTRDGIIKSALRKCGVIGDDETPDASKVSVAAENLDTVLLHLTTQGLPLFSAEYKTIPLSQFSGAPAVFTVETGVNSYNTTQKPLKIMGLTLFDDSANTNQPMRQHSMDDFLKLPNPEEIGQPTRFFVKPTATTLLLYIDRDPDTYWDTNGYLKGYIQTEFKTGYSAGTALEFPGYWEMAIVYALAEAMAPEYAVPISDRTILRQEAARFLAEAKEFSDEGTSVKLRPAKRH